MKKVMKTIAPFISIISLIVILTTAILVFKNGDQIDSPGFQRYLWWTGLMSLVWFVFSPFWLIRDES